MAKPDGTFTAQVSPLPWRLKEGSNWKDSSPEEVSKERVVIQGDQRDRVRTASLGGDRLIGSMKLPDGGSVDLLWDKALPVPTASDKGVTFAGVRPGVDLVVNRRNEGFTTYFIVKDSNALEALDKEPINLNWAGEGVTVRTDGDGDFEFVKAGKTVARVPRLDMWDSLGAQSAGAQEAIEGYWQSQRFKLDTKLAGNVMQIKIPAKALSVKLKFPVIVDPALSPAVVDVVSFNNANEWHPDYMAVGTTKGFPRPADQLLYRSMFGFPLRDGAGHTLIDHAWVRHADVQLMMTHSPNNTCNKPSGEGIGLYMTGPANAKTVWGNQPAWGEFVGATAFGSGNRANGCKPHDVLYNATRAVQIAADRGWDGVSFGLKAQNEGSNANWRTYAIGGWPRISIDFGHAPVIGGIVTVDPVVVDPGVKIYVPSGQIVVGAKMWDRNALPVKMNAVVEQGGRTVIDVSGEFKESQQVNSVTFGIGAGLYNLKARAINTYGMGSEFVNVGLMEVQDPPPPPPSVEAPAKPLVQGAEHTFVINAPGNAARVEYRFDEGGVAVAPVTNGQARISWNPQKVGPWKLDVRSQNRANGTSVWVAANGLVWPKEPTKAGEWQFNGNLDNAVSGKSALKPADAGAVIFQTGSTPEETDKSLEIGKTIFSSDPLMDPTRDYGATLKFAPAASNSDRCVISGLRGANSKKIVAVVGIENGAWFGAVVDDKGLVSRLESKIDVPDNDLFRDLGISVISLPSVTKLFYFKDQVAQINNIPSDYFKGELAIGDLDFAGSSYVGCQGRLDDVRIWNGGLPGQGKAANAQAKTIQSTKKNE